MIKEDINGNQERLDKMETVKHKEKVGTKSLLELTRRFKGYSDFGLPIKIPPHQRDYIWSKDKERSWIRSICEQNMAPNLIAVYFLDPIGDLFVNDGRQRLTASSLFLDNPLEYGISKDDAISILSKIDIPIDQRQYKDNSEVMFHFMIMQQGTPVTAYEQCHGTLVYMPQYDIYYKSALEKIQKHVDSCIVILTNGAMNDTRNFRHKCQRDNLSLFLRFASQDDTFKDYESNSGLISINKILKNRYLEISLRQYFEETEREEIERVAFQFSRFLREITGLLKSTWENDLKRKGKIEETCSRFLLDVAIWARNRGLNIDKDYREFISCILRATNGGGQFSDLDKGREGKGVMLKMGGTAILKSVCLKLSLTDFFSGSNLYDLEPYKKQKNTSQGIMHNGHTTSEKDGGTKTVLQDAFSNRALGANKMSKDMQESLPNA